MGRERTYKILLSDEEVKLLQPLQDATGMNRTSAVAFLIRKYAKHETVNFQPKWTHEKGRHPEKNASLTSAPLQET